MKTAFTPSGIFRAKKTLYEEFVPDELPHREKEIEELSHNLIDVIKEGRSSNVLCFGKSGTGKTACVKYVGERMHTQGAKENITVKHLYIPPEIDTEPELYSFVGNEIAEKNTIPRRGLSTGAMFSMMKEAIDKKPQRVILTLDEIDLFFKRHGDTFLYNLTRINSKLKQSTLCFIGISNDLKFTERFDPRVKSSLNAREIIFPPYNAVQLQDILKQRAAIAFNENAMSGGVLQLCAALSSQEHGDARKALELLRVAGEIAEEEGRAKVLEADVRKAHSKIEVDRTSEVIKSLPAQSKLLLLSVIFNEESAKPEIYTSDVYNTYRNLAKEVAVTVLKQRRITDLINELNMLGIITAHPLYRGKLGRTKEIALNIDIESAKETLLRDPTLSSFAAYKEPVQKRFL